LIGRTEISGPKKGEPRPETVAPPRSARRSIVEVCR
jgi:hypothetical protein